LSATDVVNLPVGQRDLLVSKITDVAGSNEPTLEYASERLLELMLTRGVYLPSEDYRDIVRPAVDWAFEKRFGDRIGKLTLRDALEIAAFVARGEAHKIIMEEFIALLGRVDLEQMDNSYLHTFREVIVALLANPACTEGSPQLKVAFRRVNSIQRSR
jgi:hypothetical protein